MCVVATLHISKAAQNMDLLGVGDFALTSHWYKKNVRTSGTSENLTLAMFAIPFLTTRC